MFSYGITAEGNLTTLNDETVINVAKSKGVTRLCASPIFWEEDSAQT